MTPAKETELRIAAASAYVSAGLRLNTKNGSPVLKNCRKNDIDDIDDVTLAKLRSIGDGHPWAKAAKTLLDNEDVARDVIFTMCSVPGPACVQAGADILFKNGLDASWAWETAELIEDKSRNLLDVAAELDQLSSGGVAVGPWHTTPDFDRAMKCCARAVDCIKLSRADDIPALSSTEWNWIISAAMQIPALARTADADCGELLAVLKTAGFDFRQNQGSKAGYKSLDSHLKRFTVRLWWRHGLVPPMGRYRKHLCNLVSFAVRQTDYAGVEMIRAAAVLIGKLVSSANILAREYENTLVYEFEVEAAKAVSHRISQTCSYLEDQGGCPAIICTLLSYAPPTRTNLLGWESDIASANRGVTWHNGLEIPPSTSTASTECCGGASPTECADARVENRGTHTVHTGKPGSLFGSLFDD
jgi:hypothetical protein